MENSFVDCVVSLYKQNKWREILGLGSLNDSIAKNLLWVWPSEENLFFIQKNVTKHFCEGVTSVGCGCGLFEWLLHVCTGVAVTGYEINEEWWKSKYSNPKFVELRFAEPFPQKCPSVAKEQALMFCYFNNHEAFVTYLAKYRGRLVFIIGPGEGRHTHTDPDPFKPNFESSDWALVDSQEIRNSKDYIAVYKRT